MFKYVLIAIRGCMQVVDMVGYEDESLHNRSYRTIRNKGYGQGLNVDSVGDQAGPGGYDRISDFVLSNVFYVTHRHTE